jgi:phosphatidylglycerophosphate synthase
MDAAPKQATSPVDCYSAADRGLMIRSQRMREAVLDPLLELLTRARIRANHLTALSFVFGLAFLPLFLCVGPAVALAVLAVHVFLDGLDGPLARRQGRAASRGSFADSFSDQIVVIATTLALLLAGRAGVLPGVLYLVTYTLVVAFALVRNALRIPYTWLVRPRFAVYAWIAIDAWFLPGTLDWVLGFFAALLGWKVASGFLRIHRAL